MEESLLNSDLNHFQFISHYSTFCISNHPLHQSHSTKPLLLLLLAIRLMWWTAARATSATRSTIKLPSVSGQQEKTFYTCSNIRKLHFLNHSTFHKLANQYRAISNCSRSTQMCMQALWILPFLVSYSVTTKSRHQKHVYFRLSYL